jgi:hypothetical protein
MDSEEIQYCTFIEHRVREGESLDSIAEKYSLVWQDITQFNFGTDIPSEVNRCLHEYTGCTKRTLDGKNYVFSDDDVPGILYIPKPPTPLKLATNKTYRIRINRPRLYSRVEVQTVDEFGHRIGNVDLLLRSIDGLPDVSLHSGSDGYGKLDKILAGRYQVLLPNGKPTYFSDFDHNYAANSQQDLSDLVEAVIDTRCHSSAITRVVVLRTITEEERSGRRLLKQVYSRTGVKTSLKGRGEETSGETKHSACYCVDNLALAAGWTTDYSAVNLKQLVSTVLRSFLHDYHPTALARGYHVLILEPGARLLFFVNSDGHIEKKFAMADGVELKGLVGAYAMFENISGLRFVDMASMSTVVEVSSANEEIQSDIDKIVADSQGLIETINQHNGEVQILYYAPTAQQLGSIALLGGTGRLEDYGYDSDVNDSIHQRNLAVCHSIKEAYEGYVALYIEKVKKTTSEDELRKLGPPRSPYEMPSPAGSTNSQKIDIFNALSSNELHAWTAIAHQLDHFTNRLSQGYPFLRIKPKYVANPKIINKIKNRLRPGIPDISEKIPVEVEVEMNIDIQLVDGRFEVITKSDALIKAKVKLDSVVKKVTSKGVPVEIAFKQSLGHAEKRVVSLRFANFQIECDTVGKTKMSLQASPGIWIDSEINTRSGVFGGGVTLKGKDLASKMRGKGPLFDRWASKLENVELQVQIGLVGTREETILATVSHSPGFFERRSLKELLDPNTQWNDLTLDEQQALAVLGWYGASWDGKYYTEFKDTVPDSVSKGRDELSSSEKVAIVHLGFYTYEDYGKTLKKSINEFSD